ncbi:MAG TPA: alpha/beta hydrolase-fold protein [Vicinamibacteria bacterium]|nr:alpha/beta hydrolase-fold protein [Vicinamibacteria bacterium]
MHIERHGWQSPRLGKWMGINVYGHYGSPVLVFPTSGGDENEYAGQGMIDALAHHIDSGRVKLFCVNSVNNESWYDKHSHPRHRSYVQVLYDAYVADEVVPFIYDQCRSPGIGITTTGASFGAYHAANSLFRHPNVFRRCLALSGVYDIRSFMGGDYDDNCYFHNPVDYLANLSDPWYLHQLSEDDIRLATGTGAYEDSGPTYRLSEILRGRGIPHTVDDWGKDGGHDWPYWKNQMNTYLARLPF